MGKACLPPPGHFAAAENSSSSWLKLRDLFRLQIFINLRCLILCFTNLQYNSQIIVDTNKLNVSKLTWRMNTDDAGGVTHVNKVRVDRFVFGVVLGVCFCMNPRKKFGQPIIEC